MGAECARAHMMRSNTKIQINSANSDLILQAHLEITKGVIHRVTRGTSHTAYRPKSPYIIHYSVVLQHYLTLA